MTYGLVLGSCIFCTVLTLAVYALLRAAAEKSGLCEKIFENFDERPKSLLYSIAMDSYMFSLPGAGTSDSLEQQVYLATFDTIRHIAEQGPCVIIGRCASAILRGAGEHPLSVFIYADPADRTRRIAARNGLDERRAMHRARKIDRMRKHHFDFYADTLWGEPASYDLMLSSSEYGVSGAASVIASAKEAMRHE